jgi:hypothetical protein
MPGQDDGVWEEDLRPRSRLGQLPSFATLGVRLLTSTFQAALHQLQYNVTVNMKIELQAKHIQTVSAPSINS